ncbi:MAG: hypothetical protein IKW08_03075 [Roseburia sp.]|nr:hypothetical protein [Roseburia sp.]
MDGLIILIIWGVIISKIVKAVKGEGKGKSTKEPAISEMLRQQVRQTMAQKDAYYSSQQKRTKERLQQKYAVQQKQAAQQKYNVQQRYTTQQKPPLKQDILSKAKDNVKESEPNKMEQQVHAEVCRDFRTNAHVASDVAQHKEQSVFCDTGEESDIIKRVNDLIVTGYSGDMAFDRDFISEGVDMLNRFTI